MTAEPFWPWDEGYEDVPEDEPEPCPLGWRDARCGRFGPCGCEPKWPVRGTT